MQPIFGWHWILHTAILLHFVGSTGIPLLVSLILLFKNTQRSSLFFLGGSVCIVIPWYEVTCQNFSALSTTALVPTAESIHSSCLTPSTLLKQVQAASDKELSFSRDFESSAHFSCVVVAGSREWFIISLMSFARLSCRAVQSVSISFIAQVPTVTICSASFYRQYLLKAPWAFLSVFLGAKDWRCVWGSLRCYTHRGR